MKRTTKYVPLWRKWAMVMLAAVLTLGSALGILPGGKVYAENEGHLLDLKINKLEANGGQPYYNFYGTSYNFYDHNVKDYRVFVPYDATTVKLYASLFPVHNENDTIRVRYNGENVVESAALVDNVPLELVPAADVVYFDVVNSLSGDVSTYTATLERTMKGSGTDEDPYQIETARHLTMIPLIFDYSYNKTFKLMNDIELTSEWKPYNWQGKLDGNSKTIRGVSVATNDTDYAGFFTYVSGGPDFWIKNLSLEYAPSGLTAIGGSYVGGLAGKINNNATLTNVSVTGTIAVSGSSAGATGGLVGFNSGGTIDNGASYGQVLVSGDIFGSSSVGGLVGQNNGTIRNSLSEANVDAASAAGNNVSAGGLVGLSGSGSIMQSSARGNVSAKDKVGGVLGEVLGSGAFTNVFSSSATVSGTGDYVGGLIGYVTTGNTLYNYAANHVSGGASAQHVGGLYGFYNFSANNPVTDVYWDSAITGMTDLDGWKTNPPAGDVKGSPGSKADTSNMQTQAFYNGWPFDTVWTMIGNGGYPQLQWANGLRKLSLTNEAGVPLPFGTLYPAAPQSFAPATTDYELRVPAGTTQVKLTAGPFVSMHKLNVRYNGGTVNPAPVTGLLNYEVPLNSSATRLFVDVYDSDGTTLLRTYTIKLTFDMAGDGSAGAPYQVTSAQQLAMIGSGPYGLDNAFQLMNDIDLTDYLSSNGDGYDSGKGWRPIGFEGNDQFTGTLQGNGHTIGGLWMDRTNELIDDRAGLFATIGGPNVVVSNLRITADTAKGGVQGRSFVGTLAGLMEAGTLSSIRVETVVRGTQNDSAAGGIIGGANGTTIINSSASGVVRGWTFVGGITGSIVAGTIRNSFATSDVYAVCLGGGVLGIMYSGTVAGSYATGKVTTSGGGCSATAAGGLIGGVYSGSVMKSYAAGTIVSSSQGIGGGLIGSASPNFTAPGSFWDVTATGQSNSRGGTGKITADMQKRETYDGWDWADTWLLAPNSYPALQWSVPGHRPTDIQVSSNEVEENAPSGTFVGTLTADDPDAAEAFAYSLVPASIGQGIAPGADTDNASFAIVGDTLMTSAPLDYESGGVKHILVAVTDSSYRIYWKPLTVNVTDMPESPTELMLTPGSVAEGQPIGTAVGTLQAVDPDAFDSNAFALVAGVGDDDNASFTLDGNVLKTNAMFDFETKSSYKVRIGTTDSVYGATYAYSKPFTVVIADVNEAPTDVALSAATVAENAPAGTTVGTFSAVVAEPGDTFVYSLVDGVGSDDNGSFAIAGDQLKTGMPFDFESKSTYHIRVNVFDGVYALQKPFTIAVTDVPEFTEPDPTPTPTPAPTPTLSPTPAPTPTPSPTPNAGVEVIVNGDRENRLAQASVEENGGRRRVTVALDEDKIADRLAQEGSGTVIAIPVTGASNQVIGELTGATVKQMEGKQAVLVIETDGARYKLPAEQINIDSVSTGLGSAVALSDIVVRVQIGDSSAEQETLLRQTADGESFMPILAPVNFTVTATYNGQTVEVKKFQAYVERELLLPEGVDPSKVTTAIVLHDDGTVTHVPTYVEFRDGRYYARVNSLTNSAYSVIWNPRSFADMSGHWAQAQVNDMASRKIVVGVSDVAFEPERPVTRAEFAAIVIRALGLPTDGAEQPFADVSPSDWYAGAVESAASYGIVRGYDDGTYRPAQPISRQEAFVMLGAALMLAGLPDAASSPGQALAAFADRGQLAAWAAGSAAALVDAGVVRGRTAELAPLAPITRAESAAIVQQLLVKAGLINAATP
ncbi:MAG: S-layer homology domain-containing protein [Paenibacillaceae bacterium]|nr:S-layer homology domain-containing protein [Paenibacillaceae bacterium]